MCTIFQLDQWFSKHTSWKYLKIIRFIYLHILFSIFSYLIDNFMTNELYNNCSQSAAKHASTRCTALSSYWSNKVVSSVILLVVLFETGCFAMYSKWPLVLCSQMFLGKEKSYDVRSGEWGGQAKSWNSWMCAKLWFSYTMSQIS